MSFRSIKEASEILRTLMPNASREMIEDLAADLFAPDDALGLDTLLNPRTRKRRKRRR